VLHLQPKQERHHRGYQVTSRTQSHGRCAAGAGNSQARPQEGRRRRRHSCRSCRQEDRRQKAPAAKKAAAVKAPAASADADKAPAKRGRKPKAKEADEDMDDADLSDIDSELEGEVEEEASTEASAAPAEKVKPLRMKISKAKERALMKEFGLDETVLTEEEMNTRRQRLKMLIKLGKTRGYLTHAEINDHLPDKLVDAETLEVVISMLNDMGVAVYEQTPDAETLLLNNTGQSATTEEEAEEEAEAALSTVDSEFGRTTDPVRMYMREMGTSNC
jgi:RNA polymerase primary sigma factor